MLLETVELVNVNVDAPLSYTAPSRDVLSVKLLFLMLTVVVPPAYTPAPRSADE